MSWWKTALYDTCSLITLDKLLLERPGLARQFPIGIRALNESFTSDQMRSETVERIRPRVTTQALPSLAELATLLRDARPSRALATVDTLVYATAVHFQLAVVTADKRLATAIQRQGLLVGNIALILKEKPTALSAEHLEGKLVLTSTTPRLQAFFREFGNRVVGEPIALQRNGGERKGR